jgi:pseudouridine synthase
MKLRLHQFLSQTGRFASKREAKEAVWAGEVTVDGSVVKDIAFQFNPNTKDVRYKEEYLKLPGSHRTFLLNKPRGVVCSRLNSQESELGKASVFDLFNDRVSETDVARLMTAGRLDEDTTGLLIVTTDGELAHRIASPMHHVTKTYAVGTAQPLTAEDRQRLSEGVEIELETNGKLERYTTLPAISVGTENGMTLLTITEGKKRQVRRMMAAIGHEVTALARIRIGGLNLWLFDLNEGEMLEVSQMDIEAMLFRE